MDIQLGDIIECRIDKNLFLHTLDSLIGETVQARIVRMFFNPGYITVEIANGEFLGFYIYVFLSDFPNYWRVKTRVPRKEVEAKGWWFK